MEQWIPVKNYEKLYEVSSHGRVKSLSKTWYSGPNNQTAKTKPDMIMKLPVSNHGYYIITLYDGVKHRRKVTVHRLVLEHFKDNPENKPCINHIDHVRTNNNINNLEWCTYAENNEHSRWYKIPPEEHANIIVEYTEKKKSMKEIGRMYGVTENAIGKILKDVPKNPIVRGPSPMKGKKITSDNYIKYIEGYKKRKVPTKKIICVDTGKVYNSIKEASEDTGCRSDSISGVVSGRNKKTNKLTFRYYTDNI